MTDFYTPRQDGIASLEDFGDVEHGTGYHDWSPVYVDGELVVGRCTEPELVSQYFARGGEKTPLPTRWARPGRKALSFSPGWSEKLVYSSPGDIYIDENGDYQLGTSGSGVTSRKGLPPSDD